MVPAFPVVVKISPSIAHPAPAVVTEKLSSPSVPPLAVKERLWPYAMVLEEVIDNDA